MMNDNIIDHQKTVDHMAENCNGIIQLKALSSISSYDTIGYSEHVDQWAEWSNSN